MFAFQTSRTPLFYRLIGLSLVLLTLSSKPQADTSNDWLMNAAIIGAIGSLGYACYEGQAPCSFNPSLNTDKLTLSYDIGADDTIQNNRLALGADWQEPLFDNARFRIGGRWEINANYWYSTRKDPDESNGYIVGLTPVFHYLWKAGRYNPYLELGGGPQYLSSATIENEFKSTQFQFGSLLGLGVESDRFEIGYRYLHISNANIELPNPGTDFHNLHLGYKF
ncbi:MAG: acyloxyacyl hydrolase [Hydrogenovibrio sp.]